MASLETIQNELETQRKLVEDFNKAQDEKLQAKADGKSVVDIQAKLENMHVVIEAQAAKIDQLEKVLAEKSMNSVKESANKEMALFQNFMTKGDTTFMNAVRTDQDASGGFGVPVELDRTIEKLVIDSGAMTNICTVVQNASPKYEKLVDVKGTGVANTVELQIIDNTSTPALVKITPVWGKMEAKPLISQEALSDTFFNAEEWIRESVGEKFQDHAEDMLLNGNGSSGQTKGLLAYDIVEQADGVRDFGKFEFIKTGVAGGFTPTSAANHTNPVDDFIDLIYKVKAGYRNDACFLMNENTLATIRKFKNAQADFLWQPRVTLGEPERLLNYPLRTSPYMPVIADDALAVAFGNFKRGLKVLFRKGLYVVRDPYTKKPNVEFSFVKRYALMLNNSEAIKFLKLAD